MPRNARTKRKGLDGDYSEPVTLRFTFDNFESLAHEPGDSKLVERFDGRRHYWQINLYPGGKTDADSAYVSVFLKMKGGGGYDGLDANASLTIRDAAGHMFKHGQLVKHRYGDGDSGLGWKQWVKRSMILDEENNVLSDGALIIDVEVQIIGRKKTKFQPTNPTLKNLQELCECEDQSNIKFKVEEEVIPAHKLILSMNAPLLAEFCGKKKTVTIDNTSPAVFRIVLRYIYGEEAPDVDVVVSKGKEIIEAANRYEIVGLKMAVEKTLVEQQVINLTNVADWIVFADSKTCALMKEHAQAYFIKRVKDVLALESSSELKESPQLLQELLLASSSAALHLETTYTGYSASEMSVDELREKLEEKGLDVDGSKEVLVLRLSAAEDFQAED